MNAPRVFVPIRSKHDLSAAEAFGPVVLLIRNLPFSVDRPEMVSRLLRAELQRQQFDPSRDFVAVVPPLISGAMLYGLVLSEYGQVRALFFDARTGEYVERTMKVPAGRTTA